MKDYDPIGGCHAATLPECPHTAALPVVGGSDDRGSRRPPRYDRGIDSAPSSLRGPRLALGAARPRLPGYPIAPASALVTTLIETDTLSVGIGNEVCVGLADPRTRKRPLKASAARGSVIGTRHEGHRDPVAHGLSNP